MKKSKLVFVDKNIAPEKATHCYSCKKICHYPCQLSEIKDKGCRRLGGCEAFGLFGFLTKYFGISINCR